MKVTAKHMVKLVEIAPSDATHYIEEDYHNGNNQNECFYKKVEGDWLFFRPLYSNMGWMHSEQEVNEFDLIVLTPKESSMKPVFTQEMSDNGELPSVGGDVMMRVVKNSAEPLASRPSGWLEYTVKYASEFIVVLFSKSEGRDVAIALDNDSLTVDFKPLDTRTEKEKACDAIWRELDDSGKEYDLRVAMELAYDKWVGK